MNIGIINPYFNSLAGGERYTLTLASHWSKAHGVSVFWDDPQLLKKASERLHLDLSNVQVVPNIFRKRNLLSKCIETRNYDVLFFLSDGSVPTSFAKHNILLFQMPFAHIPFPFWKKRMYDAIVVYSNFTKNNLDLVAGGNARVIYPPVDTNVKFVKNKEKIILSVGRFTKAHEMKKQSVLIESFKKITHKIPGWQLVLAGGLLQSDEDYFASLEKKSKNLSITLHANISHESLKNYYKKASIYWHAAGYGESDPTLQEHFGISTVEAMAYGCIPIVYNGGGQREIVEDGKTGYLWNTPDELIKKTSNSIRNDLRNEVFKARIIEKSRMFDVSVFNNSFDKLLSQITS